MTLQEKIKAELNRRIDMEQDTLQYQLNEASNHIIRAFALSVKVQTMAEIAKDVIDFYKDDSDGNEED